MQKPATPAKAMMEAVERLRAAQGGAFPAPRAVRRETKGGQERAAQAILAVEVIHGINTHLRHTLPDEFQAELPTQGSTATLSVEALGELPPELQARANDFFGGLGAAFRKYANELTDRVVVAEKIYEDETAAMHEKVLAAARDSDEQERASAEARERLRDEIATLRVQVGTLTGKLEARDAELVVRQRAFDEQLAQACKSSAIADQRQADRITDLEAELKTERERCRAAEQDASRLAAVVESQHADIARRDAERAAAEAANAQLSAELNRSLSSRKRSRGKAVEVPVGA